MEKTVKNIFCGLLLILLLIPSLGLIIDNSLYEGCEKRTLTERPALVAKKETVTALERYYKDHAGLRSFWNHLSSTIKYKLFRSSSKPSSAVIGKEGWLHYASVGDNEIASLSKKDLWSEEQLQNKVSSWEVRRNKLADKGISYHVAFWPNKPTIYPEYLSDKMNRLIVSGPSKADQVMDYCRSNSSFTPLDTREYLTRQKDKKLYHQLDSHWNDLGAYHAYRALMLELGIQPYDLSEFTISWEESEEGDLRYLMGLCNLEAVSETVPKLTFNGSSDTKKIKAEKGPSYFLNETAESDKTLLVFRDSYFSALIPYVSLHFKVGYYPWSYYDQKLIEELQPDVVLSANVERRL